MVTPVFAPAPTTQLTPSRPTSRDEIWFYVASRGHHAEIGGVSPGSMPAASTRVEQEGVLIDNWLLVQDGRLREAETISLLDDRRVPVPRPGHQPRRPARPDRRERQGHRRTAPHGRALRPGRRARRTWATCRRTRPSRSAGSSPRCTTASYAYELDNGAVIKVAVRVDREARTAEIDFTGTSPQLAGNFNAPSSVAMAAVLYVFRTLVDDDIPLNSGCLQPLNVIIPPGSMLAPQYPAAVAAGNVETSQASPGRSTRRSA